MTRVLQPIWRDERGSNTAQAAAVAIAAMLLITALFNGFSALGPAAQKSFDCLAAAISGGGACGLGAGTAPGSGEEDKPWWQDLGDLLGDAWDWLSDNVFSPIGNFLGDAWDWLWSEHEATWWKDFLGWLRDKGPLGYGAAAVLGFLADFLFGVGTDGKFTWGGVIVSTLLTVAAFFSGGLTKIPAIARMLGKGSQLLKWLQGTRIFKWLAGTGLGKWLTKVGPGGLKDLLDGKFGTVLKELLPRLEGRFPWIKRMLDATFMGVSLRKILEPAGNYLYTLLKDGPFGLAKDIAGKLIKRFAPSAIKEAFERLGPMREWFDLFDWLRKPKWPWPFS
ncbi:MAG TPA: hypothetical protein VGD69_13080 [Herpetosiphonaceae bacterium]